MLQDAEDGARNLKKNNVYMSMFCCLKNTFNVKLPKNYCSPPVMVNH